MDKYDETHRIISNMAGVKMRLNSHKGNIEECEPEYIIKKLREEVDELEEAVANGQMLMITEESADVFNYLVALVHQQVELYRRRK